MSEITERTRLNTQQRMLILAMLARGDNQKDIISEIDARFGVAISGVLISQIKKRHADVLDTMTKEIMKAETEDAQMLLSEARRQISGKLKKSRSDESKLEALDRKYRNGDLTKAEYTQQRSGYLTLSVRDLGDLSDKLYKQATNHGQDDEDPNKQMGDMRMVQEITKAIKDGNTIELQRIIFNAEPDPSEA